MKLHTLLAVLLEGPALDQIMAVLDGWGLEAWGRLVRLNEPRSAGHLRTILLIFLRPVHLTGGFTEKLARWER